MSELNIMFSNPNMLLTLKVVFLVITFLYGLFSFVVFKQVKLMDISFKTPYGPIFIILSLIHFIAVVIIFLLSLIIL